MAKMCLSKEFYFAYFLLSGQKNKCGYSFSYQDLVIKVPRFAEIYSLTPAPVVSVLENRHIMQGLHRFDVICDHVCRHVQTSMTSQCKTFCYASNLYIIKRKFKFLSRI